MSDGRGSVKARPVLIISVGDDRIPDDLLVLAVTGSIENPCPAHHIPIALGQVRGLTKPSVIKCNWPLDISPHRVLRSIGDLPDDLLELAFLAYDNLLNDAEFRGWID